MKSSEEMSAKKDHLFVNMTNEKRVIQCSYKDRARG